MIVFLSGVSGAGKDTIIRALMKQNDNIESLPSYTTRQPRNNDEAGNSYNFVTVEEFEKMIENDEFYEYNIHHEAYYGTSKKLLNEKINNGKIIIKDVDVNGAENLKKLLDENQKIIMIFLRVPKDVLQKRLEKRDDNLSSSQITLRLNRLEYEESKIGEYDYVIKNNNLEKTINIIKSIIENECKYKETEF